MDHSKYDSKDLTEDHAYLSQKWFAKCNLFLEGEQFLTLPQIGHQTDFDIVGCGESRCKTENNLVQSKKNRMRRV